MPKTVEELLHKLDKEQAVYKVETSTILADHTKEIGTLREDAKKFTEYVYSKFEGMWVKIISLVSGLIGIALFIAKFFL